MPRQAADKVMQFVEEQLKKEPGLSSRELYERAKKVYRSVGKLSVRQFHAMYPLVVKRRLAAKKPPRRPKAKKARAAKTRTQITESKVDREAVRKVLLQFAKDLATAKGQVGTIEVLTGLDAYVDKIVKASR